VECGVGRKAPRQTPFQPKGLENRQPGVTSFSLRPECDFKCQSPAFLGGIGSDVFHRTYARRQWQTL